MSPGRVEFALWRASKKESSALVKERVWWSGRPPAPCTYVQCLRDKSVLSPAQQAKLAQRLGANTHLVPLDSCHLAPLDQPNEIATLLNQIALNVK